MSEQISGVCIFLIVLFIVISITIFIYRHIIHPPIVEFPVKGGGLAFVSLYKVDKGYDKFKFIRIKGKWKRDFEDAEELVKYYILVILAPPIFLIINFGLADVLLILKISFFIDAFMAVLLFGLPLLLTLEAYIVLMLYIRKQRLQNMDSEGRKEYIYETAEKKIKFILKVFVFVMWFGILCLLSILLVMSGTILCLMSIKESLPGAVFALGTSGVTIFVAGALLYGWICLRKPLMGDYSCYVPIKITGKWRKYDPQYLLGRLNDKRSNVILLKNKQGQVRIYGSGNEYVLEIRSVKEEGERYYHLMQLDTDSVVPVLDDTPIVIENKWNEKFPVRKQWLVDKETISAFLQKLYSYKDIPAAMDGFSYGDTTEEIIKLMEADAYIVPEIPVDWPVGGLQSNMGQAWLRRKEVRIQRALKILERG